MKTLEQLAGWLAFGLSILMVYGFLAMFLIGPTHARDIPCEKAGNCNLDFIEHIFDRPQPTFAQMPWPNPIYSLGCEYDPMCGIDAAETTDDCQSVDGPMVGCQAHNNAITGTIPLPRKRPYVSGLGPNPEYGYRLGVQKYVPNTQPRVPDAVFDSKDQEYLER